jgi:hypothetical protein
VLVRILSVAQALDEGVGDAEGLREVVVEAERLTGHGRLHALESIGNGGVVDAGGGEGLLGEAPAGLAADEAAVEVQLVGQGAVFVGRGDDGDVFEVLGGGADEGGTADVDVLDDLGEAGIGIGGGLLKGIEVDDDHVDGLDAVGGGLVAMGLIAAHVEDAAVDFGVQRLDAAVEHFGEAGEVGDLAHGEAGIAQGFRGASSGNQLDFMASETLREIHEAGFVRHAQQRAGDLFVTAQGDCSGSCPNAGAEKTIVNNGETSA